MRSFAVGAKAALITSVLLITACNGSSSSSSSPAADTNTTNTPVVSALPPVLQCAAAERLPAELITADALEKVTSQLPNVYDTVNYSGDVLPSTSFDVSIALPERCPGDRFPVVIHSHGYGGEVSNTLDENGEVDKTAFFPQILELFQALPHYGYVAVSFDQRGHGESQPDNGGGLARVMDPQAETQDAIRLLDWLAENADRFSIYLEETDIAKDIRVGLIGYSYGGGWQFPLALLDRRVDTIVPSGTWHSLINSLLPGDAVKLSFDGLLCLFADGNGPPDPGVTNTPAVEAMCNQIGYRSPQANLIRTKDDLMRTLELQGYDRDVVLQMFNRQVRHFQAQNGVGPWCDSDRPGCNDQSTFVARPVPTLLLQGNRDVLFHLTEAYWNYQFFDSIKDANTKVAVLTNEGGHMNPLDHLFEGSADCGGLVGTEVIKAWFEVHLKGASSPLLDTLPNVCISVANTQSAHTAQPQGLLLDYFPAGSQPVDKGGVPVRLEAAEVSVGQGPDDSYLGANFLELYTVPSDAGDNIVLAGIPSIDAITVTGVGSPSDAIAFFGVGIERASGDKILVDAEVTGLIENAEPYTSNPNVGNDRFLLPGVGERLQPGDKVGLFFYQRHVQFSAIINGASASGATTLIQTAAGTTYPDPVASAINEQDSVLNPPNPYDVSVVGVELPLFDLRRLPAGALSLGAVSGSAP